MRTASHRGSAAFSITSNRTIAWAISRSCPTSTIPSSRASSPGAASTTRRDSSRTWSGSGAMTACRNDVPQFITESNIAWQTSESFVDIYGALWLADYVGAYLTAGGNAVYYFHYFPLGVHPGCNARRARLACSRRTRTSEVQQYTSQYFASQLINLDWVEPGDGVHTLFPASSDVVDSSGHVLVTAYAVLRPDGQWSSAHRQQRPGEFTFGAHRIRLTQRPAKSFHSPVKFTSRRSGALSTYGTPTARAAPPTRTGPRRNPPSRQANQPRSSCPKPQSP